MSAQTESQISFPASVSREAGEYFIQLMKRLVVAVSEDSLQILRLPPSCMAESSPRSTSWMKKMLERQEYQGLAKPQPASLNIKPLPIG